MPPVWFTESARWCTVLGFALSLFFLLRAGRLGPKLKTYQALSWLNLAALLGMITSLPFAPPWDGETRIFAATLPLFFLLPASGVGGLYLLIVSGFRKVTVESKAYFQQRIAIGGPAIMGGMLSLVIVLASWYFVDTRSGSQSRLPPAVSLLLDLRAKADSVRSFDLRSLQVGYHLRVTDDTQRTWLPNISRKDLIQNVSQGPRPFSQLPPGTEVVVLPYFILLVLDKEDAQMKRFTPRPDQTGHVVSPPVYFSNLLEVESGH